MSVAENATDADDAEGRPPHSVEAVVSGGTDADICQTLASTVAAGIATHGNTSGTGTDVSGKSRVIEFSRPQPKYAWLEIDIVSTDPDGGPASGYEDAIRSAVVAYGNSYFPPGANYILQKMYAPIYSVPGIYSVTLRIATSDSELGPHTYGPDNLPIALREYLTFSASRVEFVP